MKPLVSLLLGITLGCLLTALYLLMPYHQPASVAPSLSELLAHANTPIDNQQFACEGLGENSVAAVVASLLEANNSYPLNRLNYGCYQDYCSLSVSSCLPWQSSECSERFLRFKRDSSLLIEPQSFSCFDVP